MAGGGKKSKPAGPVKAFGREYNKNKGKIDRNRNYDEEDIIKRNQASSSSGSEDSGSEDSGSENETKRPVSKLGSDSSDDEVVVQSRNPNKAQPVKRSLKPVAGVKKGAKQEESSDEEDSDEESSEEEVSNPNRMKQVTQKVSQINLNAKVELSRREKEEIARQQAALRANEKQQKSDLERLQVIRKQREEQAKRKEEEKKAQEEKMAERRRLGLQ